MDWCPSREDIFADMIIIYLLLVYILVLPSVVFDVKSSFGLAFLSFFSSFFLRDVIVTMALLGCVLLVV